MQEKWKFLEPDEGETIYDVIRYVRSSENEGWEEPMGEDYFSFDGKKIYNYWEDYPHNLTKEEVEIFKKERPFWANFKK